MTLLRIHLFARARELAGTACLEVRLEPGSSVARLRVRLAEQVPALASILPRCAIAIDQNFRSDEDTVPEQAEVAVIPPVSGGSGWLLLHAQQDVTGREDA